MNEHYAIVIEWSDADHTYVVTLPEWGVHTHGDTYDEALRMGKELLIELVAERQEHGEALPTPRIYVGV